MFLVILSIAAIVLSTVVLQLGNNMIAPILVLRASASGENLGYVGLIPTAYGIGFVFGCFWGQKLINRVGHIRAFAVAAALLATLAITMHLTSNTAGWIVLRAVMGCAIAIISTCADSWVGSGTPAAMRGQVMGLYATVTKLAHVTAPALLAASVFISDQGILLAAALFSLSLVPVAMATMPAPELVPGKTLSFRALFRAVPSSIAAAFAVGLANGAVLNFLPVYGLNISLPVSQAVALLAIAHFGGLTLQWPLGLLSDRVGRRAVIAGGLLVAASVSVLLSLPLLSSGNLMLMLVFIWGGTALSIYSISLSHAIDHFEGDNLVGVCATMLVIWSTASVLGPVAGGLLMGAFGPGALFQFSAACQAAAGLFVIGRMLNTSRRLRRTKFVNVPITSGQIHVLDPRSR
ncbi:MAG: MFS transporter [Rhodospirillales bacterium]|nr:MFS transporter [Rhodospirillales bacterium]